MLSGTALERDLDFKKIARSAILATVAKLVTRGASSTKISERLGELHAVDLNTLQVRIPVDRNNVTRWRRDALEVVVEDSETDQRTAKALALTRLDLTIEPLIDEIETSSASRLNVRAVETLRKVVATQAEIQGLTRARETLADALETALGSLADRYRADGTIRSSAANPPALRHDVASKDIRYALTQPDKAEVERARQDRRPASAAIVTMGETSNDAGSVISAVQRTHGHLASKQRTRDRQLGDRIPGVRGEAQDASISPAQGPMDLEE